MRQGHVYIFLALVTFQSISFGLFAQQIPQFSTYMLNPYAINPAFAGNEATLVGNLLYRKQWTDLPGGPETFHANAHCPLGILPGGVGIQIETDALGAHRANRGALSYSLPIELNRNVRIMGGITAGFLQMALDGSKLRAPEGSYELGSFLHNDPLLQEVGTTAGTPYVEIGLGLEIKKMSLGFAVQPVYAPPIRFEELVGTGFTLQRHYLFFGKYTAELSRNVYFSPSFMVKSNEKQFQGEFSALFQFRNTIFAGASFRGFSTPTRDAGVLLLGGKVNPKTTLFYSYDVPLSALKSGHRGSHELLLRYDFGRALGKGNLPPIQYNPRFM